MGSDGGIADGIDRRWRLREEYPLGRIRSAEPSSDPKDRFSFEAESDIA